MPSLYVCVDNGYGQSLVHSAFVNLIPRSLHIEWQSKCFQNAPCKDFRSNLLFYAPLAVRMVPTSCRQIIARLSTSSSSCFITRCSRTSLSKSAGSQAQYQLGLQSSGDKMLKVATLTGVAAGFELPLHGTQTASSWSTDEADLRTPR